jgi:hypothetical protein
LSGTVTQYGRCPDAESVKADRKKATGCGSHHEFCRLREVKDDSISWTMADGVSRRHALAKVSDRTMILGARDYGIFSFRSAILVPSDVRNRRIIYAFIV